MTRIRRDLPPAMTGQHAIGGRQCDGAADFGLKSFVNRAYSEHSSFLCIGKPGAQKLLLLLKGQRLSATSAMVTRLVLFFIACSPSEGVMASDSRTTDAEDAGNGGRCDGDGRRQQDAQCSESLKAKDLLKNKLI